MNSPFRASLAHLGRLRILLALSLIWLAPSLACGSFAPRPTPTPTALPQVNPVATQVASADPATTQTLPTPQPPSTDTPVPEAAPTVTLTPTVATVVPGTALAVGQPARITAPAGLNFRDRPGAGGTLLGQFGTGIRVSVLEGPTTADDFTWWRVDDGQGNVGWVAQGDDETEWLSPQIGEPQPANRPPRVGDRVVVTMPGGGQLSVRAQPGVDAPLLTRANSGQQFTVQAGPQAANGFTWYQIRSDDGSVEGWAADGDGGARWLSPLE